MKYFLFFLLLLPSVVEAQVEVVKQNKKEQAGFRLASHNSTAVVYFDTADFVSVKTTARLFVEDIERVTGKQPGLVSSKSKLQE
jgi:hypothetical protein